MANTKVTNGVEEILTSIEAHLTKLEARDLATFKRIDHGLTSGNFKFYNSDRLREVKANLEIAYSRLSNPNQDRAAERYSNMLTQLDNLISIEDPAESIRELVVKYEAERKSQNYKASCEQIIPKSKR